MKVDTVNTVGGDSMNSSAKDFSGTDSIISKTEVIETTLLELIEVIGEEARPSEDRMVIEVVAHLLDTGRIIRKGGSKLVNDEAFRVRAV